MEKRTITVDQINAFAAYLRDEEHETGTIEKYLRDVRAFLAWAGGRAVNKELAAAWKGHLKAGGYQPETINSFARTFYHACHDVAKLADMPSHSSIETTRIYLISIGAEHARQLERLGLIS